MFLKVLHQPAPAASAKGGSEPGRAGQDRRRRGQQPVRNLHAPVDCWLVTAFAQCRMVAGID